ncbi:ABC transporter permease [Desulfovibrio aerotolerans]|uniref:ABC transporter permease n=1 Tax=Solidesulfovibrio aerotolerans TaxID=295255 RepID=A0A7C9N092_9BACT|nr:FtsX-like permease family protein [Solidesulfovibrio aerotolerans]MYL83017.1 ABC transporter permease [Solidesulfovibrio aerotolerans]
MPPPFLFPLVCRRLSGRAVVALLLGIILCLLAAGPAAAKRVKKSAADTGDNALAASWLGVTDADLDRAVIDALAGLGDRSPGSPGASAAADALEAYFKGLGVGEVGRLRYRAPAMVHGPTRLSVAGGGQTTLTPLALNAFTPGSIPPEGLTGPLVYAGAGSYRDFDGTSPQDAIVLMDLHSGRNWQAAAQLGAKAVVYIDDSPAERPADNGVFQDKFELTPVRFPRFLLSGAQASQLLGDYRSLKGDPAGQSATLAAKAAWEPVVASNIHLLIPGTDPALAGQLLVVDAAYDAGALTPGQAPGADEAASVAALVRLARRLAAEPPARPTLLLATSGRSQSLVGLREFFAALRGKGKDLRSQYRDLTESVRHADTLLASLDRLTAGGEEGGKLLADPAVRETLLETLKDEVDVVTTRLMRLRLAGKDRDETAIAALATRRGDLRRIMWRDDFVQLPPSEAAALMALVPAAKTRLADTRAAAAAEAECVESARDLRKLLGDRDIAAQVSLHLSSHGDGVGSFYQGFAFAVKPDVNPGQAYGRINRSLGAAAEAAGKAAGLPTNYYRDGMRADRQHPWQGLLPDRPALGGEFANIAGVLGITLATVGDARQAWGTPGDTPARVDFASLASQGRFVVDVLASMTAADFEVGEKRPRNVFSTLTGRVNFIRQGELFPDRPAPGTVVCVYQGKTRFYAITDARGQFRVNGLANKKFVLDKAVIEGYRFDPDTGSAVWAIDKKQTGKDAYRVKMNRNAMETDLIMFGCDQTTLFSAFDPRSFRYFTRIELLDARREAPPMRSWFSRLDTLDSTLLSIFLEPGTPFKCILSDTVLSRKLLLLNADAAHPTGVGYPVDANPVLPATELLGARDMWALVGPRIATLEAHGIVSERLRDLTDRGRALYADALAAKEAKRFDAMVSAARSSWALAVRVYNDVEKTQRDVLLGVLFYIALFIPFAYCVERVVFNYADIHKRIAAFLATLTAVIAVVYAVHPAFKLTYSPLVVIIAFFILGLSVMVAAIIFMRFEREMAALQRRASHVKATEIGGMRAFAAAFVIGVSNLRRRKVRTALTCLTLIILTFTIMSFTSIKSTRDEGAAQVSDTAPYQGVLLKNIGWHSLPPESLAVLADACGTTEVVAPLAWLELPEKTVAPITHLRVGEHSEMVQGIIGLSADESRLGRMAGLLSAGQWFAPGQTDAVILPQPMAERLGVAPGGTVTLFGRTFTVVGLFRKNALEERPDLDGEALTPVVFPSEVSKESSEAEKEAAESGEDVKTLQSRYQHIDDDLVVIVPYETLMGLGGQLKSVVVAPPAGSAAEASATAEAGSALAGRLADRFGLAVFSGQADGVFLYHAGDSLGYAGVTNILIPLVISVLIVLNTMIGAVYERKREIGVYTAVGLAPSHVSFLFIAEALAFAVISVVLGYLLAQVTAGLLSGTSLWAGMTANYSSTAGVAAMLLVIAVVLLSVIYPSKVASQIAIPDVNRSWTLPEAVDGVITTRLPFLVKVREQECAGGFLFDYYQAHQDVSHGLFATADVDYVFECPWDMPGASPHPKERHPEFCDLRACMRLTGTVWLAPFDFGIKQSVSIVFTPAWETPGYMEIDVALTRVAGEAGMWKRLNKGFLNDLRKQLLVWRSLEESTRTSYEDKVIGGYTARLGSDAPAGEGTA